MEILNSKRIKTGELIRKREKLIKAFQVEVQDTDACKELLNELNKLASEAKLADINIFTAVILKRSMRNTDTFYKMLKDSYPSERLNSRIELFTMDESTTVQISFENNKPAHVQYAHINKEV